MFSSASFNYYLVNFYLKYIPGNIFINTIVSSTAEAISGYTSAFVVLKVGTRNAMSTMFLVCGVAGFALWLAEARGLIDAIPFAVLSAKFGISAAFNMLYMSTLQYFPSEFMGSVFGVCNVTARLITILSPMVAEAPDPTP